MHGKLRRYHFQWHRSHVQLKSKSSAIIKIILTFYKTENNNFFFFAEALEHGFAMTGAALRRRRCWERERKSKGGGGAHQRGKDGRRCLLGSAHAAAQGGAAWGPHDGSGHR
jgi:hypothetical protein